MHLQNILGSWKDILYKKTSTVWGFWNDRSYYGQPMKLLNLIINNVTLLIDIWLKKVKDIV